MIIKYSILNPTGNITALAETPVKTELQPAVALEIMKREPTVEQVGFVSGNCLRMAGGEFCGNASMSAAALLCERKGAQSGTTESVILNVSGADGSICVEVLKNHDGSYTCSVDMPKPVSVEDVSLEYDGTVYSFPAVRFRGMTHIINEGQIDAEAAENAIRKWCRDLNSDGLGIMFFDRGSMELKPLVYVPEPETLFWESSCASGSAAVGAYLACSENRPVSIMLNEPAGTLSVKAGSGIILKGSVRIVSPDNELKID